MLDPAAATELATTDPCEDRTERHLRILQELADIGMELARAVKARALDPEAEPAAAAELVLTFSRIARAVRQTVALEARIDRDRQAAAVERAERRVRETLDRALRRKARVRDLVERAIDSEASGAAAEDLLLDLDERLEDADDLAGFADRPVAEIVARICGDLGVAPPPNLWDDEGWGIVQDQTSLTPGIRPDDSGPDWDPRELATNDTNTTNAPQGRPGRGPIPDS